MTTLLGIVGIYLLLLVTWVFYAAIMNMREKMDKLSPIAKFNAYVALFVFGYPLDVIANIIVSLVAFQRPPMRPLLTGTLKYWINSNDKRRSKWAGYICRDLLNPFDDDHCG